MSFDDPRGTWNARFAGSEFHFGRAPNAFVAREVARLARGQSVLEETFRGWELLRLDDYDAEISEGTGHVGMSALIDLVARKPG